MKCIGVPYPFAKKGAFKEIVLYASRKERTDKLREDLIREILIFKFIVEYSKYDYLGILNAINKLDIHGLWGMYQKYRVKYFDKLEELKIDIDQRMAYDIMPQKKDRLKLLLTLYN